MHDELKYVDGKWYEHEDLIPMVVLGAFMNECTYFTLNFMFLFLSHSDCFTCKHLDVLIYFDNMLLSSFISIYVQYNHSRL